MSSDSGTRCSCSGSTAGALFQVAVRDDAATGFSEAREGAGDGIPPAPLLFLQRFASRAAASAKARGKARWYIDALLKVPWWRFREQNAEGQYHNFVKKAIINAKIIPTGSQRGIAETAWWMRSRSRPRGVRSARLRELHGGGGSVSGVQVRQIKTLALTGPDEATFITYQISTNSGRAGSGQLD